MRRILLAAVLASLLAAAPASAVPTLVRDVKTGVWRGGSNHPANPDNVVAGYQEGRIDSGGDATNGFATTFDGGKTWTYGELPGLTTYPGQTGTFDRASDAVVAFGPDNTVYANSLVFDI